MTKREKDRFETAINNQYNKERRQQGCAQVILALFLWLGVIWFIHFTISTL
jgi:hypothetical protein